MGGMLALLLAAAPQAKVIRAETFVTSSGASEREAAEAAAAMKDELVKQGYRIDEKGGEFVLSGLISKETDKLTIDAQLSKSEDRTLVASARVVCSSALKACAHQTAEQLGSKLRETTGVRVKLTKPDSRAR